MTLPTLRAFANGEHVRLVQTAINAAGIATDTPLKVDGIYGPKTCAAVGEFQSSRGLVPDQITGPKTWSELARPMSLRGRTPIEEDPWVPVVRKLIGVAAASPVPPVATATWSAPPLQLGVGAPRLAKSPVQPKTSAPVSTSRYTGFRITDLDATQITLSDWLGFLKRLPGPLKALTFVAAGACTIKLVDDAGKKYSMTGSGGGVDLSISPLEAAAAAAPTIGGKAVKAWFKSLGIPIGSVATGRVYRLNRGYPGMGVGELAKPLTLIYTIKAENGLGVGGHLVLFGADLWPFLMPGSPGPLIHMIGAANAFAFVATGEAKISLGGIGGQLLGYSMRVQ